MKCTVILKQILSETRSAFYVLISFGILLTWVLENFVPRTTVIFFRYSGTKLLPCISLITVITIIVH